MKFYIAFNVLILWCFFASSQVKKFDHESILLVKQQCNVCHGKKMIENKEILLNSSSKTELLNNHFHNYHIAILKNNSKKTIWLDDQLMDAFERSNSGLEPYFYYLKGKMLLSKKVFSEALISFQTALTSVTNSKLKGYLYANAAYIYQEQEEYKTALNYLDNAILIFKKLGDEYAIKTLYKNKALCYLHLKEYKKSEKTYKEIIQQEEKLKDTLGLTITMMDLANLYYEQYQDNEAIPLFKKALKLAKITKNSEALKTAYHNMAVVEENLKNYKTAISYFKKYSIINDSITNGDRVWKLAEQQKAFELEKKEKEISLLEKDRQLKVADLKIKKQQRNLFLSIAVGLFLITLLIGFFYKNNIRKKKLIQDQKNDLNDLNNLKDELFSVLAHDLRSHVSNLMFISDELETAHANKNTKGIKTLILQNDASTNKTFQLLDNLLHWVMVQSKRMFFQKENIRLLRLIKHMEETYSSAISLKNISFIINIPSNLNSSFDMNSLKIILRNLIDNAIKFTPERGTITIEGVEGENASLLLIKDTGKGMSNEQLLSLKSTFLKASSDTSGRKSTGLGLRLCYSFLKRNNGEITINSIENSGTTIQLFLPKPS